MRVNYIENIDCLIGMHEIPDESVDCVVTDCPYLLVGGGCSEGEYRTKNGHSQPSCIMNRQRGQTKHITLSGTLNDNAEDVRKGKMFEHNNIKFSDWLPDVYRVLKNGTHCYIMINSRNLKELQEEAEKVGFQFQNLLVWRKNSATPNKYYMQQLEFILMLRKGAARNVNDMGMTNCLSVPNIIGKGAKNEHPTAKPIALCLVCALTFTSCTEQFRARNFGGKLKIEVPEGYKVTSATWKESELFYFLEPMEEGYVPKEKKFVESSSFGIFESEVVFKEKALKKNN